MSGKTWIYSDPHFYQPSVGVVERVAKALWLSAGFREDLWDAPSGNWKTHMEECRPTWLRHARAALSAAIPTASEPSMYPDDGGLKEPVREYRPVVSELIREHFSPNTIPATEASGEIVKSWVEQTGELPEHCPEPNTSEIVQAHTDRIASRMGAKFVPHDFDTQIASEQPWETLRRICQAETSWYDEQGWKRRTDLFLAHSGVGNVVAERYRWAANELLVCDYGDNDCCEMGWHVYGWRSPGGGRRIYGASVDEAIDAQLALSTPEPVEPQTDREKGA